MYVCMFIQATQRNVGGERRSISMAEGGVHGWRKEEYEYRSYQIGTINGQ